MNAPAIRTAEFRGQAIPVIAHEGDQWITGEQIGRALGYEHPRQRINDLFRRNRDELSEYSLELKLRSSEPPTRIYNEEGVMVLTMLSRQPVAQQFRRWAVGILKAYRHGDLAQESDDTARLREDNARLRDELLDLQRRYIQAIDAPAKPKRRRVSPAEKQRILDLARRGWNRAAIVAETGRPEGTISALISRAQRDGTLPH
jgi:prophage antirepressor-like protein